MFWSCFEASVTVFDYFWPIAITLKQQTAIKKIF